MMKINKTIIILFIFLFQNVTGQNKYERERIVEISRIFQDVKTICNTDNGKLWGKNLWAPILVIDRNTRFIVANIQDSAGLLKQKGNVFYGYFPKDKIISNSTTNFGGTFWTMVGDLLNDKQDRNSIFVHELFHRLQPQIGLGSLSYNNNHMDKMQARILLKLEWSALEKAIVQHGNKRKRCIADALIFRKKRRMLYDQAAINENKFELHEGLAVYTQYEMTTTNNNELLDKLISKKNKYWSSKNYMRTFGYYSGFLYSYLLDQTNYNWRKKINRNSDLGKLTQKAYNIILPKDVNRYFDRIKSKYSFKNIYHFEQQRKRHNDSLIASYYRIFIDDTVLILPLYHPHIGFNPSEAHPFDTIGTIYSFIIITDKWGRIDVIKEGCLLSKNWSTATIPIRKREIDDNIVKTSNWALKLNKGWFISKNGKNYTLNQKE